MPIADRFIFRWLVIPYSPRPEARGFMDAAVSQQRDELDVRVAVLDDAASRAFFGVPMARRGIQPVGFTSSTARIGPTGSSSWPSIRIIFPRSKPRPPTTTRAENDCLDSASWRGCYFGHYSSCFR